mgnify:CR=1 FL=1
MRKREEVLAQLEELKATYRRLKEECKTSPTNLSLLNITKEMIQDLRTELKEIDAANAPK